jgi:FAD/FMN-containing dehydrogenase
MREFGTPVLDLCAPKPFLVHQSMFDPSFPAGWWYYFRSTNLAKLTDDVIDVVADRAPRMTSSLTAFPIFQLGGAIARVGEDETAYTGRDAGHTININATTATSEGFDDERTWSRDFWSALEPFHTSVYSNFLMEEGEDRIRQAYGSEKYDRLKALKRQYDPENLFRLNQNIAPD